MGAGTFLSLRGSKAKRRAQSNLVPTLSTDCVISAQIWQTTYAALTAILFLDAALAPCTRLSRPLRPIMLVLRPDLRNPEAMQSTELS